MTKRKRTKRPSGKRNTRTSSGPRRGDKYSPAELFVAAVGALLIVLFVGIVITSLISE